MNSIPTVTIIMATYNRGHFILESLLSIQNQTYLNWECLIVDDGGTDNTKEVIASILEHDSRFQFLKRPDSYKKGLPGCRNIGLDLAKGDYVIFFDDDDIIHPDNLKINIEVLERNNLDFCNYQKMSFEKQKPIIEGNPISIIKSLTKADIEKIITQKIGLASCTVLWKKQCFETTRFNESLLYAEEWECYCQIITKNFKGISISNVLYYNRKHIHSNTGEFYSNNPIHKASKKDAALLIIENLKSKEMLTDSLLRYFIQMSLQYKEYNLFESIIEASKLSAVQRFKWKIFYRLLPLRLSLYRIKKRIIKNK
jgi:GalNAc5-diNAcBac-PP-undecaprenol beta-1,3-glucosyltransferase